MCGYSFKGLKCWCVVDEDFEKFDFILVMDNDNLKNLWGMSDFFYYEKIKLFLDFVGYEGEEVLDFYYGGKKGFELVLDFIEIVSDGFIVSLKF